MSISVRLVARGGEAELHFWPSPGTNEPTLVVLTPGQAHGHFKTATRTTAGTTIIVQPKPGLSIQVTDIIVSGEKQAGSSVSVQFTDGGDTEVMIKVDQVDSSPNLAPNLQSYFRGWKDARVEIVTAGAGDGTVTVGYIHSNAALTYAEWDAER